MKMGRIPFLFLLALSLLLPSCRKSGEESGSGKVRTENVDGVTLVHNPPVPQHPEKTVRFEEEISFGGEEEGPGAVYKPGQYVIDERNRVHIADAADGTIKVFDGEGRYLREIGRKGQGPAPCHGFPEQADIDLRPRGGFSRKLSMDEQYPHPAPGPRRCLRRPGIRARRERNKDVPQDLRLRGT